jgi:hypothetical protein
MAQGIEYIFQFLTRHSITLRLAPSTTFAQVTQIIRSMRPNLSRVHFRYIRQTPVGGRNGSLTDSMTLGSTGVQKFWIRIARQIPESTTRGSPTEAGPRPGEEPRGSGTPTASPDSSSSSDVDSIITSLAEMGFPAPDREAVAAKLRQVRSKERALFFFIENPSAPAGARGPPQPAPGPSDPLGERAAPSGLQGSGLSPIDSVITNLDEMGFPALDRDDGTARPRQFGYKQ